MLHSSHEEGKRVLFETADNQTSYTLYILIDDFDLQSLCETWSVQFQKAIKWCEWNWVS